MSSYKQFIDNLGFAIALVLLGAMIILPAILTIVLADLAATHFGTIVGIIVGVITFIVTFAISVTLNQLRKGEHHD